jgi:hypothetical protein
MEKHLNNKWFVTATVFLILIAVAYILNSPSATSTKDNDSSSPEIERVYCPTETTFTEIWNHWSYEYINSNPYAGVDEQMDDWNALMVQNGCSEEWFDPLADLIEQQGASGTPVYWYE